MKESEQNLRTRLCVIMNIEQAEYSYWKRTDCRQAVLHSVICETSKRNSILNQNELTLTFCSKTHVHFDGFCFYLANRTLPYAGILNKNIMLYISMVFFSLDDYNNAPDAGSGVESSAVTYKNAVVSDNIIGTHFNIFQCMNHQYISTLFVCDGINHCKLGDLSDEQCPHTLKTKGKSLDSASVNQTDSGSCTINFYKDRSGQCKSYINPVHLQVPNYNVKMSKMYQKKQNTKLFSCGTAQGGMYFFFEHCLFDTNQNGSLLYCPNGMHLRSCSIFQCMGRFKCPKSYCVSYFHVCNRKWDCPFGHDEMNCNLFNCSNMFKCADERQGESHCIHLLDVCDGFVHCKLGDDEASCDLVECNSRGCLCLNRAITCKESPNVEDYFQLFLCLPFTYIFISDSVDRFPQFPLFKGTRKIILELPSNKISEICRAMNNRAFLQKIVKLDLGHNQILAVGKNCFDFAKHLVVLTLKGNKISKIVSHTFNNLPCLTILDLSKNFVTSLDSFAFKGLSLHLLNLSQTVAFQFIHESSYESVNPQIHIVTVDGHMCCFIDQACASNKLNPSSCDHLLFVGPLSVYVLSFQLVFVLLVNGTAVLLTTKCAEKKDYQMKKKSGYLHVSLVINVNGLLLSATFAFLLTVDNLCSIQAMGSHIARTGDMLCSFIGPWLVFLWLSSTSVLTLLVFSRYKVISQPLKTKFKYASFIKGSLSIMYIVLIGVTTFIGVLYNFTVGFQISEMSFCSLIGPADSSATSFVIVFLFLCCVVIGLVSAAAIHSLAQNEPIGDLSKQDPKLAISRIIHIAVGNIPCHVASIILLCLVPWMKTLHLQRALWLCLVPFPFSCNPILLNFKTVSDKVRSLISGRVQ